MKIMANVTINPDKTISVNGKKTFPVYMYSICNAYFETHNGGMVEPCDPSKNSEFLFSAGGSFNLLYDKLDYKNKFEKAGVGYTFDIKTIDDVAQELKDSPSFFGYYQPDEPADDQLPKISAYYKRVKAIEPDHLVIQNVWTDMTKWAPSTDIITWDMYTIRNIKYWPREDSIYAYEQWSRQSFFENKYEVNSISKPVWAVIQANGVNEGDRLVPTPNEVRANTYTAITMDVKGIGFWSYLGWGGSLDPTPSFPYGTSGLYNKPSLHSYYRQLARELNTLNDILVLPTKDYSWHYHQGTKVLFSAGLTKTVLWQTRNNFNYILKQSGNTNYLIVVNKDSRPLSNVKLTITDLTGVMSAKTLGLETSGSGRTGRVLSVNNGQFTDSFDGLAVHIYEIGSDIPCPPSQCDFTITQ